MRRSEASMLPAMTGPPGKASLARCQYTVTARSGRLFGSAFVV